MNGTFLLQEVWTCPSTSSALDVARWSSDQERHFSGVCTSWQDQITGGFVAVGARRVSRALARGHKRFVSESAVEGGCATSFGPSMGSWTSVDHNLSKIIEEVVSEFRDEFANTCRKCRVTSVGFGGKSRCVLRAAGASAPGSRSEPLRS